MYVITLLFTGLTFHSSIWPSVDYEASIKCTSISLQHLCSFKHNIDACLFEMNDALVRLSSSGVS